MTPETRRQVELRLKRIAPAHGYVIEDAKHTVQEYIDQLLGRSSPIVEIP